VGSIPLAHRTATQPDPRPTTPHDLSLRQGTRATRRFIARLRHASVFRTYNPLLATDGASDRELHLLAGPLGRLQVEDVRWDLIGAAHSGKRHRT
jgi:hypothetical protein